MIKLYRNPKIFGNYTQIGEYDKMPIYVGPKPTKEWVAMPTDDGKGVVINREAYDALKVSRFNVSYLDTICERIVSFSTNPQKEMNDKDHEVHSYLQICGVLKH
jgi:hypothetical protein